MNEILYSLLFVIFIIWLGCFLAGFLLYDLKNSQYLKYESLNKIINDKYYKNYVQVCLYFIMNNFVLFLIFPVKISNWITWKTIIKDKNE